MALTGGAGCGKSTVLRLVATDLAPPAGAVETDGQVRWLVPALALTHDEAVELVRTIRCAWTRIAPDARSSR